MQKKLFRHRRCKIKIKETKKCVDVDIILPNNDKYGKKFIDNRPDKTIPMVENEAFEWQLIEETNRLLHETGQ